MANSEYRIVLDCNRLSGTVGVSVSAAWSLPGHYRPASPYGPNLSATVAHFKGVEEHDQLSFFLSSYVDSGI
ncbi:hypothetical protein T09_1289 [Trichinella sp. T9]|nr:hypothetical protein T09_8376 [Trichinella sp. T9]KRX51415.1 hypothetical protein T09_10769 [Trichinella sp. T9]KRX56146.1 hypothetical protein T09_1289 [Trichinella sp. T9]